MAVFRRTRTRLQLLRLWLRNPRTRQQIVRFATENWALRLVALLLAVVVWGYVQITTSTTVSLTVPLDTIRVGDQFQAQVFTTNGEPLQALLVSVQCAYRDRDKLRDSDYTTAIDLRDEQETVLSAYQLKPAENIVYHGPERYKAIGTISAIMPDRLRIVIDRTVQKNVPVLAQLVGQPRDGYRVSSTLVNPAAVMVKGPVRLMDTLDALLTEPVDITGLSRPLLKSSVRLMTTNMPIVVLDKAPLEVRIGINTKPVQRVVTGVGVAALGRPRYANDARFSPGTVTVILEGTREFVDAVDPRDLDVFVDVRDLTSSGAIVPVVTLPPEHCNIVSVMPRTVTVTLTEN